jgi:adenylate kinase
MIVVVTGLVGLDKKSYLAGQRGKDVQLFNVGDRMYAEAPDIGAGRILDIPLKRLHSLRRSVFKDIIAKAKKSKSSRRVGGAKNIIVNTHATFRWRHGLFPAVDFDQMRQLGADLYVCLIDGVAALHTRLAKEHSVEHTLKDLIVWREEEIICTEMLGRGIDEAVPFYCVARGEENETTEMFYRLLFEPERKKAYLSFPMTAVADMEMVRGEIGNFRRAMKEHFICFDPGDLEESYLPIYAHRAKEQGQGFLEANPVRESTVGGINQPSSLSSNDHQLKSAAFSNGAKSLGKTIRLETGQVLEIERDINSQTYARDFMLIDQADMIVSFIPTIADGRAAISSGVERELQHAHESAKEVFVIWPAKQRPSVFVTQTATKVFGGVDEAMGFFAKKGYERK